MSNDSFWGFWLLVNFIGVFVGVAVLHPITDKTRNQITNFDLIKVTTFVVVCPLTAALMAVAISAIALMMKVSDLHTAFVLNLKTEPQGRFYRFLNKKPFSKE